MDDVDDVEANFVSILKKANGKYRGKLPFKCFNYENIGHYASRCPIKSLKDKYKENKGKSVKKS